VDLAARKEAGLNCKPADIFAKIPDQLPKNIIRGVILNQQRRDDDNRMNAQAVQTIEIEESMEETV
jgi:hypothetical protein